MPGLFGEVGVHGVSVTRRWARRGLVGLLVAGVSVAGCSASAPAHAEQAFTLKLTPGGVPLHLAPFSSYREWSMPHAGRIEGMSADGSYVVMGLLGDPRSSSVNAAADADRVGVLDIRSGILQVLPEINAGWVTEAVADGGWLLRRETSASSTGCTTAGDCQRWRLYVQPLDLSSAPRLLAQSARAGATVDEPNPVSDGRVAVWQQLGTDGTLETMAAALPTGKPVVLTHTFGPAVELALDGAGNVLIDCPAAAGSQTTDLVRVNIATRRASLVGLRNAHYPTLLGNRLVTVTNGLTTVEASDYRSDRAATATRVVSVSQDVYDAQQISSRLVLAYNVDGLIVVDMSNRRQYRLRIDIDSRASVAAADGLLAFAIQRGTTETLIAATS